ncbi:MAG: high-potential iron-sulfur protein [Halobacteria archaeon]|nr:high-potential iron-sulfur protein [Halobacteria archaeon]
MERRHFLKVTAAGFAALSAGCMGNGGGNGGGGNGSNGGPDLSGPVPESERTATSLGGTQRNPNSLQSKSSAEYQSSPQNGQKCSNCTYYIEDQSGDGLGACALVSGKIEPNGYCILYAEYQQ